MSDQERQQKPQTTARPAEVEQPLPPVQTANTEDDVLTSILAAYTQPAPTEVTGAADQRPELRSISNEQYVRANRQERGE